MSGVIGLNPAYGTSKTKSTTTCMVTTRVNEKNPADTSRSQKCKTQNYMWDSKGNLRKTHVSMKQGVPFRACTDWSRQIINLNCHEGSRSWRTWQPNGSHWDSYTRTGFYSNRHIDDYPDRFAWEDSSARNQSVVECLNKMADAKVNLGQFLAESKQTASMIASGASTLWRALLHAKRGNLRGILDMGMGAVRRQGIATPGNILLQYRYGWKPLMQDLDGLMDSFRDTIPKGPHIHAVRRVKYNGAKKRVNHNDVEWYEGQWSSSYTTRLWATINPSALHGLTQYGLTNPAALAWELIPYSFVVDWGLPIGSFLEACSAHVGLDFLGGCTTFYTSGKYTGGAEVGTFDMPFMRTARQAYGSWPKPLPYAKVQSPLSSSHITSALALLAQLR